MKQTKWILLWVCTLAVMLCGCTAIQTSGKPIDSEEFIAAEEKVLTLDGVSITEAEANVYLYLMQKPYEAYYGSELWQMQREDGTTWGKWLVEEVKRQIVQIEILNRRAVQEGMKLSEEEKQSADTAADAAFMGMRNLANRYGITSECIRQVYEKSQLAGCYYQTVMDGCGLTLSEEEIAECRGMMVQQIFIAENDTQHLKDGQTQQQLAEELENRSTEGEDFETLSKAYSSENMQWLLSFDEAGYVFDTDGWLEEDFTRAAWLLQEDEVSPVIQTSYGYHVIKCIAVDTDELKQQAAEKKLNDRKRQAFSEDYEKWLQDVVVTEETAWKKLRVLEGI